jgi:molybdenum cofactor sulfurtransferase
MELAKQKFLEEYPKYGYNNQLNAILSTEFPNLVTHPQIYLDNTAIPPIPTQLVISLATAQASLPWLQNPHSSPQIHDQINLTKLKLLNYFKCSELEYEVIFCSNVTSGLKLIGEHFPWTESSKLILSLQNHTSAVGIREYAQKAGSSIELINLEDMYNNEYKFNSNNDKSLNLLCLPAQTNWNGLKLPSSLDLSSIVPSNTLTLIDFASYAQSNALSISEFGADFNLISFYKIFGIMTGLSCLIVKKSSLNKLNSGYFGGGGLLACDIYSSYKELNTNTCWEFGTPNYMDILNLSSCFNYFEGVFGSMDNVGIHTRSLANWTKLELKKLKHYNNTPLIELYSNDEKFDYGPIIAFNVLRSNGDKVGLKHLESILNLNNILVRVGSLCNPGSNQLYLNVTGEQVRDSFDKGIRCGDGELGVCRASLGKVTTFEECFELVKVIREKFIELQEPPPKQIDSSKNFKLPEVLEINICKLTNQKLILN